MEKETVGKIKICRKIRLKNLNDIISKAKKSYVQGATIMELEKVAYRGLLEWRLIFGYSRSGYERAIEKHMVEYIENVKNYVRERSEQDDIFEKEKHYLENAYQRDYIDPNIAKVFYTKTGLSVDHRKRYYYWQ